MISTIGYEGARLEDFLQTLLAAEIEIIVDVRELPASRRKGFSKNKLREALAEVGIDYVHLRGLGDPKEGRDAARAGNHQLFEKIFLSHLDTPEAQSDLAQASQILKNQGACLLCYEREPRSCHRYYVANTLSGIVGLQVRHLGVREGLAASDKIGAREIAYIS